MKIFPILSGCVLWGMAGVGSAREWLSLEGKKLEADFISAQGDQVTLKRSNDGQTFSIPLARLSEADRNWVKQQKPAKPAAAAKPIEGPFAKLITGAWELSEFEGMKFAFYGGKDLTAAEKIPLVLTLHGKSKNEENGKQVGGWMKSFAKPENYAERPCFIVAPMSAQPESGEGMGWTGKQLDQLLKLMKALVKGLPVDPKRVYTAGHSMGGFGVCHVMAKDSRLFAAGIPVAGASTSDAAALARKPMWMFHATDDATVPVSTARDFAKLMKMSKPFKLTELPEGGHGVVGKVFDDPETHKWLFEQRLK
jgi:predicted peptidase